ncbi:MAG TPA: ester cyclase [Bryobacteraceae bacterium]|nr:ester cyclase [Bryobacteraceae bacterium]
MAETILHEWFRRVWTQGDRNAVYDLLGADALIHELDERGGDSRGPDEFLVFFDRVRSAIPDMKVEVHDVVAAADWIAGRWTATGSHTGDQLGFPATQRPLRVSGMSLARIRDGRIAEGWNIWDRLGFMEQLGFELRTPPPA